MNSRNSRLLHSYRFHSFPFARPHPSRRRPIPIRKERPRDIKIERSVSNVIKLNRSFSHNIKLHDIYEDASATANKPNNHVKRNDDIFTTYPSNVETYPVEEEEVEEVYYETTTKHEDESHYENVGATVDQNVGTDDDLFPDQEEDVPVKCYEYFSNPVVSK